VTAAADLVPVQLHRHLPYIPELDPVSTRSRLRTRVPDSLQHPEQVVGFDPLTPRNTSSSLVNIADRS